jgi:CubicO group peptidase (beta-lactamase class C family)
MSTRRRCMYASRVAIATGCVMVWMCLSLANANPAADADPAPNTAAGDDSLKMRMDRGVPGILAEHKVPSVSIAHIERGVVVFTGAYGEQSRGVPATPRTLYNIASLTKPLSAEVVLRLVSQGRVSLDEPMYRYWTDPDIANDERRKLLTPRIALSHQTGFPNWRRQTNHVLTFKRNPGEAYGYSGEGFMYLARFVQAKVGSQFDSLAQELLLTPTHMSDTAYTQRPWFEKRIAVPTDTDGRAVTPELTDQWNAADLVYTTANDYARFMIAVMKGDGLTPELAAERARIQVHEGTPRCSPVRVDGCPEESGFGLGWEVIKLAGETFLTHDGSDDGVATYAYINVTQKSGTVILTNSTNGPSIVDPILILLGSDLKFVHCQRDGFC